ncbi:DUF2569 family protein [Spongiivirga citrea]|uniref:DUF2569 family protein n=1 Tax=Spongiivirga citrea TaxID=1481457 RepID=A0A6M0CTM2_9FLAO|nr:DUF2569 family protein [Spongiivirga citrea]NER17140.1 DUF2569 family protein [Spongiivirga citrea]
MSLKLLPQILIIFFLSYSASAQVKKAKHPRWVTKIEVKDENVVDNSGGFKYLLIDNQDNIVEKTIYRKYAFKLLNSEGIQNMSTISVDFDPKYQALVFHEISVVRGNKRYDRLEDSFIKTIQRETGMDRSLYDGSLTAIVDLSDIRKGDIIQYSYTIKGFNPINKGSYFSSFYQKFTFPCSRVFQRVIALNEEQLNFKYFLGAKAPKKSRVGSNVAYSWDFSADDVLVFDNNTPSWYDPQKNVQVSTYSNWSEVVNWALPLYKYDKKTIRNLIPDNNDRVLKDQILDAIRLVQDEIRYLGFESGIGAYRPNAPRKVFDQRFGDCKDKSLLLVSLLREIGVESHPFLVNTYLKNEIEKVMPSHTVFDHCIVNFSYDGKDYFVDPTVSNQGGDINNLFLPNYQFGLLIKQGENNLKRIETSPITSIEIQEDIFVNEIGKEALIKVKTEYTGSRADFMRSYFDNNSRETIQQQFLNFYSSLYPSVQTERDFEIDDSERSVSNRLVTTEFYKVDDFWQDAEDEQNIYAEIYPLELESIIQHTKSAKRKMPYWAGEPTNFTKTSTIRLPETWNVEPVSNKIEGLGFSYMSEMNGFGKIVTVKYDYKLAKDVIEADEVEDFLKKHDEIQSDLSSYITYNVKAANAKGISYIPILTSLITIILFSIFCFKIYKKYNPSNEISISNKKGIGGWLILPAIGITITPFVLIVGVLTGGFLDESTWVALGSYDAATRIEIGALYLFELVYNVGSMIFVILLCILFYSKRTSLPKLIIIFYVLNVVFQIIDIVLADLILSDVLTNTDYKNSSKGIIRGIIAAAIWIPYFFKSERVKNTFVNTYQDIHGAR